MKRATLDELVDKISQVPDPEVPVLTIADLGILRSVVDGDDGVVVTITPTYSGCPAMGFIRDQIMAAASSCGRPDTRVEFVLSPAWTTEWMSADGRRKLTEFGIAPPQPVAVMMESSPLAIIHRDSIQCPNCDSLATEVISEFSSTACKALYRCTTCSEPFDYFKEL